MKRCCILKFRLATMLTLALAACGDRVAVPAGSGVPAQTTSKPAGQSAPPLNPAVHVRYGSQEQVSGAGVYLAQDEGYFKQEGLDVEFIRVQGGSDSIAALASGDLDVSTGNLDPAFFNAVLRGAELKVALPLTLNRTDQVSSGLIVRQDLLDSGRYKDLRDLKGMTIGAGPSSGASTEFFLSLVLQKAGLTKADVNLVVMPFVDEATAITNKKLDAAWQIQPFISNLLAQGTVKVVAPLTDYYPGAVTNTLQVSPVFAQKQPDAVKRFVTAELRGQREYWHAFIKKDAPELRDPIIQVLTKYTPVKDPKAWTDTVMPSVDPNGQISDQMLDDFQSYFVKAGTQKEKLDVNRVVDRAWVGYALQRLGTAEG